MYLIVSVMLAHNVHLAATKAGQREARRILHTAAWQAIPLEQYMSTSPHPDVSPSTRPVIFIGLDGAEPTLLRRWMDDGSLPILRRLEQQGVSSAVETLRGFGDGATWPTLITGVTPASHGRYFRRQFRPRSYRRMEFSVDCDLAREPFWTTLSRARRKVAVLDIPYAPLTSDINGVLLVDWLIHDRYGEPRSWPARFAAEVLACVGDDPLGGDSDRFAKTDPDPKHLTELLLDRVRMKQALVTKVLADGTWHLLATAFTEPHDMGHTLWHLHDRSHPQHDASWRRRHGDPMKTLYVQIDGAIGRILQGAPSNAATVVFAGLGMGPNYTAEGATSEILARLENKQYRTTFGLGNRLGAADWPRAAVRIGRIADTACEIASLSRRRFFAMDHNENSGAIRINLKGREPTGHVAAADFDAVCDELTDAFLEIRNCATGRPIVERVVRVAREMRGEHLDSMPDLLIVWNRDAPLQAIESPRIGRIDGIRSWGRTGDHSERAMLIMHGEGISANTIPSTPAVVDIAPTIAALSGVELHNVDGRPIAGLCRARA
jgi:predicted AlkP superfamily phosphohydrolase/phosphomutase